MRYANSEITLTHPLLIALSIQLVYDIQSPDRIIICRVDGPFKPLDYTLRFKNPGPLRLQ